MYKKLVLTAISSLLLFGCSNLKQATTAPEVTNTTNAPTTPQKTVQVSSELYNDSKTVYQILVDYMQNGQVITPDKQRIIDSFKSKAHLNNDKYTDIEKSLVQAILSMDSERFYYDTVTKENDRLTEMNSFNKDAMDVKQALSLITPRK